MSAKIVEYEGLTSLVLSLPPSLPHSLTHSLTHSYKLKAYSTYKM